MNANKTKIFPLTVKIIQSAKLIAIKIVCHRTNGGRIGLIVVSSSSVKLSFTFRVVLVGPVSTSKMEDEVLLKRLSGSWSFTSREDEFKA